MKVVTDLRPEIEKVFAKHERHFHIDEEISKDVHGDEAGIQKAKDLRAEFYYLKEYIVGDEETIEGDRIEELKEQIHNKLAMGTNTAGEFDWWWNEASGRSEAVLRDVLRALDKASPEKGAWFRYVSYAWKVVRELVYLAIVLGVFSVANSRFETVVIGMLILIYNAIIGARTVEGFSFIHLNAAVRQMYGEIGRSLRLKVSVSPEKKAKQQETELAIDFFIQGISILLGSLIALWKIVNAVFL
jgi:hypothetical protein